MDLHISIRDIGERTVVALDGIADLGSVPMLEDRLRRTIRQHPAATVTIDFDGLTMIDDAALGVVLGAAAHARAQGGELEVVCTGDRLRTRLATTRFDLAVTVRDAIV